MRSTLTRVQLGTGAVMAMMAGTVVFIACGGSGTPSPLNNGAVKITVKSAATGLDAPVDATPDPMGTGIYFIAKDASGPAVFHVATGGKPVLLYSGAPLVAPRGITTSSDGKTIYIADPSGGTDGKGAVYSMPSSGDTPEPLAPTAGTHPTALDIDENGTAEDLYLTGEDSSGAPAVFKLELPSGTALTEVAHGAPLEKPDGIAVATDGSVYVADAQAGKSLPGQVFKIARGKTTAFGPEVEPGSPAGIVVTLDDSKVLVSSLDPKAGTSQVAIVQTKNGTASTFNDVIKANDVSGGIHRARYKDAYAWAGKTSVYYISISPLRVDSSSIGGPGVK